ncbi:Uridine kinase, partial [Giardia duodenalis]
VLLRLVENVMQQKGQAHRDSDALIDLCALERYKCLDEDEKQLIVASLLSAKFDGLTTDVLAETIGKTVEFAAPW